MKVVIVAKTRMGSGACIGGLGFDGRSMRLIASDRETNDHFNMDYQVGEVWDINTSNVSEKVTPHIENIIVERKERSGTMMKISEFIEQKMPPLSGGTDVIFDGLTNVTNSGGLYIAEQSGIPSRSTMFWRPDRALVRVDEHKRIRYCYPTRDGGRTLTFVGFQEPIPEIPAGTLVRVSLAHWWRPDDRPDQELRCYVQISGWFLDDPAALPEMVDATSQKKQTYEDKIPRIETVLQQVFGYPNFLPYQRETIEKVLRKENTLAVMPTGSGKSMCYQLPAALFPGLTVVVSPLIALMEDQVLELEQWGIPAVYLNSTLSHTEYMKNVDLVRGCEVKLLYAAPETLLRPETIVLLEDCEVDCLVIDEAHCISEWGHDFRPEYRKLVGLRSRLPCAGTLALTATATERVRRDIKVSLQIHNANEFVSSFNRPNLFLSVVDKTNGLVQTREFLDAHAGEAGIIYCSTRETVNDLTGQLDSLGFNVLPYHAGMDDGIRRENQRRFRFEEGIVMVATIAFGMGINKSNVRFILHYNIPKNIESYYQQIGRSGRDGLRANCLLLYSYNDMGIINFFIDKQEGKLKSVSKKQLSDLLKFIDASSCRRKPLLQYFGETFKSENCGACDNCLRRESHPVSEPETETQSPVKKDFDELDLTIPARQFIMCAHKTGEIFGMMHLIKVLRGSKAKKIIKFKHDELKFYGTGRDYSKNQWRQLVGELIEQGLVIRSQAHGSIKLTNKGRAFLVEGSFFGRALVPEVGTIFKKGDLEYDGALFEELRSWRLNKAKEKGFPPYVIFHDRTLIEIAKYYPQTQAQLGHIHGIGRRKLEAYGADLLELIRAYCKRIGDVPERTHPSSLMTHKPPRIQNRMEYIWMQHQAGTSISEIADELNIETETVLAHLKNAHAAGKSLRKSGLVELSTLTRDEEQRVIQCFDQYGLEFLKPVFEALDRQIPYEQLRLWRLIYCIEKDIR